jgi:uncharacterized circularly permuted ATP-grasp superfamily protein
MTDRNRNSEYIPDRGFIGRKEVRVANYLFESGTGQGHRHARGLVTSFLRRTPLEHHRNSRRLTRYLEARGLTFRKSGKGGEQKIFPVPVTTSVVPLPKSQFDRLSAAAAILVFCMRKILREIYGGVNPDQSPFIQSLPPTERERFLKTIRESPHYIPQLHHPVMLEYPFFDQVGLDLVLVEDYGTTEGGLPFRLLEINAGSPSGASNNSVLLEGMKATDPSLLESVGPVCDNDHFDLLRTTYRSLGESWTDYREGTAILLPPGGANAAAPEIHSLAARSGLTLCEAAHLYRDPAGWVRMRSVDGSDPIVTSIYSRVNSDSVLFDPDQGVLLRDQESGEPLVCHDPLSGEVIQDQTGRPVPLESVFRVKGALSAIHQRKLYVGGLNRLLDNKLLLDVLTRYAPRFYRGDCQAAGLDPESACLLPPDSLPSNPDSVGLLSASPEEWVVKSPHLSGGTGVHVLMALPKRERSRVLREVRERPGYFAYQKMVRIARIPVSMKEASGERYRLANLAADLRMWVLYGGDGSMPKLTRNALVRFAPVEKGALSSTVNTSKGGGYAPFVIVDDGVRNGSGRPTVQDTTKSPIPVEQVPVFSAAQLIQILRMLAQLRSELDQGSPSAYRIYGILLGLSIQIKEVAAFLDPAAPEVIHSWLRRVEAKIDRNEIASFFSKINRARSEWVFNTVKIESSSPEVAAELDRLSVLHHPSIDQRGEDREVHEAVLKRISIHPESRGWISKKALPLLRLMVRARCPDRMITRLESRRMRKLLSRFENGVEERWAGSPGLAWLNDESTRVGLESRPVWIETPAVGSASRQEEEKGKLIFEMFPLEEWVQEAKYAWGLTPNSAPGDLERTREKHFQRFPRLVEIQRSIDRTSGGGVEEILSLLEVLPYARYNLERFSIASGMGVRELFTDRMSPGKIALLEKPEWRGAGACFVRKSTGTSELLEGRSHLWVSKQQSPICQAYTIGHELHHAMQVEGIRSAEKFARLNGPAGIARFMNLYGNFFGLDSGPAIEHLKNGRSVLYGLQDRLASHGESHVIREIVEAIRQSPESYEQVLEKYGGAFVTMMPSSVPTRVKALREVYPALENLKNLAFAASCGLRIPMDPMSSVLPCANRFQRDRYRKLLSAAVLSPRPESEVLRVVASHQLYGVGFGPDSVIDGRLGLRIDPSPIDPAKAYHQSQQ